jgi:hypothetical protein
LNWDGVGTGPSKPSLKVSENINYKKWEGHTDMSDKEDAPGTLETETGLVDLIYLFRFKYSHHSVAQVKSLVNLTNDLKLTVTDTVITHQQNTFLLDSP